MSTFDAPERQALADLGLDEGELRLSPPDTQRPARSARAMQGSQPVDPAANLQPFSFKWMLASVAVFAAFQVAFGWLAAGPLLAGGYLTQNMRFFVEGAVNLLSYFLSGLVIGVVSPRLRLVEPALAALIVVFTTLSVGLFTPFTLMALGPLKLVVGGALAFGLALWGATLGERLTRQM